MESAGQCSPIIRSNLKSKTPAVSSAIFDLPNVSSPAQSFLTDVTVTPLSGLRQSATVTDISWATAFETPKRNDNTPMDVSRPEDDVFVPEQSTYLPSHCISISSHEGSKCSSRETSSSAGTESGSPIISKSLSAVDVLSTFRQSKLQKAYPKAASSNSEGGRHLAVYSTPKPDRQILKMLEAPTSAILPSTELQPSTRRVKTCPCGKCSCPLVFVEDAAVQTDEAMFDHENYCNDSEYVMGGLTQQIAQEVGRYDGFTQQSIMETAKVNRKRPKSMVHFSKEMEDEVDHAISSKSFVFPSNHAESNEPFQGFKKASGAAVHGPSSDFSKIFGEDFTDLPRLKDKEVSKAKQPSPKLKSALKKPFANKVKKLFGDDFPSDLPQLHQHGGFKSAPKALDKPVCEPTDVLAKARSVFGEEDLNAAMNEQPRDPRFVGFQSSRKALQTEDRSLSCQEDLNVITNKQPPDPKFVGFQSSRKAHHAGDLSVLAEERSDFGAADVNAVVDGQPCDANSTGFRSSKTAVSVDRLAKAKSLFGDEEFNAIMRDQPRDSTFVGFQSSRKVLSVTVAEGSDVESIYNEELDSGPESPLEVEVEDSLHIPPELYFQASDQVITLSNPILASVRDEQRKIIVDKAASSNSPTKMRCQGIMARTRLFAADLRSISSLTPNFDAGVQFGDDILSVLANPYFPYRFPQQSTDDGGPVWSWQTVDGGLLVAADDGTVGWEELETCLLTTPGVIARLIPKGWVENHYRWIVWKLAKQVFAFRKEFPEASMRLNTECVAQQLKFRYDREIDEGIRSCLRRIVEKDSSPKGLMVLCVSKVISSSPEKAVGHLAGEEDYNSKDSTGSSFHNSSSSIQLELTDGWYAVKAHVDAPLYRMVQAGRIFVSCKLVIAGADLNGLDEGTDPLNLPASCHLKLYANSTRLVKKWWAAKLGFSGPVKLSVPIRSLFPGGGNAAVFKAVVLRVYPLLYVERRVVENGVNESVYRLEHDELIEADRAKAAQERKIEELMQKLTKENQSPVVSPRSVRKRRKITSTELKELGTGEDIASAIRESNDPESIEQMLTATQRDALQKYMTTRNEQLAKKIQDELLKARTEQSSIVRNVTPVLKVFVGGTSPIDRRGEICAAISIWRPPENSRDLLKEGHAYTFVNVSVSRQAVGSLVLLNGSQHTGWEPLANVTTEDIYIERSDALLKDIPVCLSNSKTANYTNKEIDLVGIVLRSSSDQAGHRKLFLVDTEGDVASLQGNSVSFNSFVVGECSRQTQPVVFVAVNLRLSTSVQLPTAIGSHGFSSSALPTLYAQDYSVFICLPPSTTTVPPRIANNYRYLEAAVKIATVNKQQLVETGLQKLELVANISPVFDNTPRNPSRTDLRPTSETGPQRPGSSTSKTPVTGSELQKRKIDKLDRICASSDASLPGISPLPAPLTASRSSSVLKRPFRTPKPVPKN